MRKPEPGINSLDERRIGPQSSSNWYPWWGKRFLDLALSGLAILLLSPAMALIALLVLLKHGSPILFSQVRPGLHGQPFTLLKFRTMTNQTDGMDVLLPAEQRVTPFGLFLRRLSLDELPELLNVFQGYMSLVGPRPLLMEYLPLYTEEQMRRHDVKPGITGWAQVNGRNEISWEQKFTLDVWYVDHVSLILDLKILWLTVLTVLRREGIGFAGAEPFKGSFPKSNT